MVQAPLSPTYLSFVRANRRFVAFGVWMGFISCFGQTFFISLFGAEIRGEFGLTHGGFGTVYSAANVLSAFALVWLGRLIDRVDLRIYSAVVCIGLGLACLGLAVAASLVTLLLAIFALRLFGQGLCGHVSVVSMVRYFDRFRGRAMSIAGLGMPAAEVVMPTIVVAATVALGWRFTWMAAAGALCIGALPFLLWLLKGHGARHRALLAESTPPATDPRDARGQWTRAAVLRDPVFYLLMPTVLANNYILTGLFFHQAHLAATKGWPLAWLATCFIGYATASVACSLASGALVDRRGAVRLLPYVLIPLALGLLGIWVSDHRTAGFVYMTASGMNVGATMIVIGALWAELYGTTHLGAIKALIAGLSTFASALAPATMGWLIDLGITMEAIALGCIAWVVLAEALIFRAQRIIIRRASP